jgi:hypothetical protein
MGKSIPTMGLEGMLRNGSTTELSIIFLSSKFHLPTNPLKLLPKPILASSMLYSFRWTLTLFLGHYSRDFEAIIKDQY